MHQNFKLPPTHALTFRSNGGLMRVIHTPVFVATADTDNKIEFRGIWDTGASHTVITQNVVDSLNLKPIGKTKVSTASEHEFETYQYIIDLYLKNDLKIKDVIVTLGKLTDNFNCLIGMDIITLGDFSITNHEKNTCMSFRIPSLREIDYVAEINKEREFIKRHFDAKRNMNNPCICNSGKKFKNCHGKNLIVT